MQKYLYIIFSTIFIIFISNAVYADSIILDNLKLRLECPRGYQDMTNQDENEFLKEILKKENLNVLKICANEFVNKDMSKYVIYMINDNLLNVNIPENHKDAVIESVYKNFKKDMKNIEVNIDRKYQDLKNNYNIQMNENVLLDSEMISHPMKGILVTSRVNVNFYGHQVQGICVMAYVFFQNTLLNVYSYSTNPYLNLTDKLSIAKEQSRNTLLFLSSLSNSSYNLNTSDSKSTEKSKFNTEHIISKSLLKGLFLGIILFIFYIFSMLIRKIFKRKK